MTSRLAGYAAPLSACIVCCALISVGCDVALSPCKADDECEPGTFCLEQKCQTLPIDGGTSDLSPADSGLLDVASGERPDATAAGLENADSGSANAGSADAGWTDAGISPGLSCSLIAGDTLLAEQIPVVLGVAARYTVAGSDSDPVAIDLSGELQEDGLLHWDFSASLVNDRDWELRALPLDAFWFASAYPASAYALPLDPEESTFGVLEKTEDHLWMWGVASAEEDQTELYFSPPVSLLRFPFSVGQSWQTETAVTGTFEFNPFYQAEDTWRMEVQASGVVHVPAGEFPVLRVMTDRHVQIPIVVPPFLLEYRTWQYSFLTPCLGQVAAITSPVNAEGPAFEEAAEFRRMGLP